MGLQAEIWAWRLGGGGGTKEEKEKKKKEEKIPHMCESIGHRPLRGCCPKGGGGEAKRRSRGQRHWIMH